MLSCFSNVAFQLQPALRHYRKAFCGGEAATSCTSSSHASKCEAHWNSNGQGEGRTWGCDNETPSRRGRAVKLTVGQGAVAADVDIGVGSLQATELRAQIPQGRAVQVDPRLTPG